MTFEARLELWLAPIHPDTPAGVDARSDAEHESVRAEIGKLTSLAGGSVDWRRVVDRGAALLSRRSKDLLIACYLAAGLLETEGLRGFSHGLTLVARLLEDYADDVFPRRTRGRAGALGWLIERASARLEGVSVQDAPLAAQALHRARHLGAASRALLGAEAPLLNPIERSLQRLALDRRAADTSATSAVVLPDAREVAPAVPAATREPPSATRVEPDVSAAAATLPVDASSAIAPAASERAPHEGRQELPSSLPSIAAAPADLPSSAADLLPFLRSTGQALVEVSRTLFEQRRSDARAYRLLRVGSWLSLGGPPAAEPDGRTRVAFPDRRARSSLERLVAAGSWESALVQSEGMVRRNPFWLDPHLLTLRCLEALGAEFAEAQAAVEHEARAFVGRYPSVLALKFLDGSPFASTETAAWFAPPPVHAMDEQVERALPAEVETALLRGAPGALQQAERRLPTCTPKAALELRLLLAQGLKAAGKSDASLTLLLSLEQELDRYRLDEWDPALALRVLRPLWQQLSSHHGVKGALSSDAQRISARLVRLAPSTLLSGQSLV